MAEGWVRLLARADGLAQVARVEVPYVSLPAQMRRIKAELMAAIERVLEDGRYVLGPDVEEFEQRFADYVGTKYAVGVGNGTSALVLSLRSIGIGRGDEIITAPNSFVASAACSALLGATPVFVDVRETDMNIDPDLIENGITKRTRAIVPVHLAGHPAEMDALLAIAARHNIPVIEDAAQSVGSMYHGRRTGSMGLTGCFSLHPLKNLHAYGDAGVVTTNDESVYNWIMKARNHGLRTRDQAEFWSCNSRLDTIQAAILNVKLNYLDQWTNERRLLANQYRREMSQVVQVPEEAADCFHTYQTYVIKATRRTDLLDHLHALGVQATVHYPLPIHLQEAAQSLHLRKDDFPVASSLADRIVSLPLFPEMTVAQRTAVIEGVRSFYEC